MKPICIYHAKCLDGFGAALAVHLAIDCDFFAANYGDEPPEVTGRDVIIVDYSYKRPVLEQMIERCNSMVILDHHKTAKDDLEGIFNHTKISGVFDMDKSGALLAWEWFHSDKPVPQLIQHISDRHLWRFHLPKTEEICEGLFSKEQNFMDWVQLIQDGKEAIDKLAADGAAIKARRDKDREYGDILNRNNLRSSLYNLCRSEKLEKNKDIDGLIESGLHWLEIQGHRVRGINVRGINLPYTMASVAGNRICQSERTPFAAVYWYDGKEYRFSLHSLPDSDVDVSDIAKQYGGGGHKNAAGFSVKSLGDL